MKYKFAIVFAVLMFAVTGSVFAQADEKAAVSVPLENYLKGHAVVDVEYTKKAFHSTGSVMSIRDGGYVSQSFADYIQGLVGRKPAVDEKKRKRYVESIDVVGNAAIAKVVSDYPSVKYVDYMAMLKIDGEWKIVNKVFFPEQKGPSAPKVEIASEKEAVRIPLENYLKGHATGDGEYMKKAFHTEGNLIFIREGKFTTRSFADYIAGMSGKPPADEDKRKRWIESVDIAGNAAFAKDHPRLSVSQICRLYVAAQDQWRVEDHKQIVFRRTENRTR